MFVAVQHGLAFLSAPSAWATLTTPLASALQPPVLRRMSCSMGQHDAAAADVLITDWILRTGLCRNAPEAGGMGSRGCACSLFTVAVFGVLTADLPSSHQYANSTPRHYHPVHKKRAKMIKEACSRIYQQQYSEWEPTQDGLRTAAMQGCKAVTKALPWRGAGKVAPGYQLSQRLVALRDELEASSAFVDWNELEEDCVLGKGSFATVRKCTYTARLAGKPQVVAVKQIKTELLGDPREVKTFLAEVKLLRKLDHRYIVKFYGCGWSRLTEEEESTHAGRPPSHHQLFFTQEYMEGGSLQEMVFRAMTSQGSRVYSDDDALRWALQIARALEYLHTRQPKIIHRDLKLENILLSRRRPSKAAAKLADFGLARRLKGASERSRAQAMRVEAVASMDLHQLDPEHRTLSNNLESRLDAWMSQPRGELAERSYHAAEMTAPAGSLGYMAPEVLRGLPYNERADVFSFAIILYNMFHRTIPTLHIMLSGTMKDLEAYAHRVAHGFRQKIGKVVPPGVISIIERGWHADPKQRPSMSEIVAALQALQPQLPEHDGEPAAAVECSCSVM